MDREKILEFLEKEEYKAEDNNNKYLFMCSDVNNRLKINVIDGKELVQMIAGIGLLNIERMLIEADGQKITIKKASSPNEKGSKDKKE